jgi:hypothetical protein
MGRTTCTEPQCLYKGCTLPIRRSQSITCNKDCIFHSQIKQPIYYFPAFSGCPGLNIHKKNCYGFCFEPAEIQHCTGISFGFIKSAEYADLASTGRSHTLNRNCDLKVGAVQHHSWLPTDIVQMHIAYSSNS